MWRSKSSSGSVQFPGDTGRDSTQAYRAESVGDYHPPLCLRRRSISGARPSSRYSLRRSVCVRCQELAATRKNVVFGAGNADADLMFVGEAPGASEDEQGLPFVGRAGKLLETLLKEIGLERKDVFIANVLKCRPPGNRDPLPVEIENCREYLYRQVELIQPRVICSLGNFSTKLLRDDPTGITRLHGKPRGAHARQAHGAALSDLPSRRGALHAAHARDAARGLRAPAGAAGACPSRRSRRRAEALEQAAAVRDRRRLGRQSPVQRWRIRIAGRESAGCVGERWPQGRGGAKWISSVSSSDDRMSKRAIRIGSQDQAPKLGGFLAAAGHPNRRGVRI